MCFWLAGAEELGMINKIQEWLIQNLVLVTLRQRGKEATFQSSHGNTSCWELDVIMWKSHLGGIGFESMKPEEAWHSEKQRKHTDESAVTVAVKVSGMKAPAKKLWTGTTKSL